DGLQRGSERRDRVGGLVGGPGRVVVLEVDPEDHLPAAGLGEGAERGQVGRGDGGDGPGRRRLPAGGPVGLVHGVAADAHHRGTQGLEITGEVPRGERGQREIGGLEGEPEGPGGERGAHRGLGDGDDRGRGGGGGGRPGEHGSGGREGEGDGRGAEPAQVGG